MTTFKDYIESVKRNNPSMVGRKITIHWDSLESLLESAYRKGRNDAVEPIHKANESMPDFLKGLFQ